MSIIPTSETSVGLYLLKFVSDGSHSWCLVFNVCLVIKKKKLQGFPGGAVGKNLPANAGDRGLSPGLGRSHMPWSN